MSVPANRTATKSHFDSKRLTPALAILSVAVAMAMSGCGAAGKSADARSGGQPGAGTARHPMSAAANALRSSSADVEGDGDDPHLTRLIDDGRYDNDDAAIVRFGRAASPAETRAIADLVKRYYRAAAADDGAKACSLTYSTVASSIPEDYGRATTGPPALRGKTCAAVMTKLFRLHLPEMAAISARRVIGVRLANGEALALMGSGGVARNDLVVRRQGRLWKIAAVNDSSMP